MDPRQLLENITISFGPISLTTDLGRRKAEVLRKLRILLNENIEISSEMQRLVNEMDRLNEIMRRGRLQTPQEKSAFNSASQEFDLLSARGKRLSEQIDDLIIEARVLGANV